MGTKSTKAIALILTHTSIFGMALAACSSDESSQNVPSDEYAILLNYNDGSSRPYTMYVEKGSSIAANDIDIPTRKGYTFANWTTDEAGASVVSFPYTPEGDIAFYAQWSISVINVTFDYNLGEGSLASETSYVMQVNYNGNITQADVDAVNARIPERDGFIFAGYWETENGTRVNFDTPYNIKKEVTFYAHWREEDTKLYNVTFDENYEGGRTHLISDIEDGASIALKDAPADPTRKGYDFLGWATTKDATEPNVTFPYTPSGPETDITLYGVWKMKTYTVTFRYNYKRNPGGASGVYKRFADTPAFSSMNEPEAITREGFEFLGWYTHAYEGQKVTFPFEVTASTNLYAHWRANRMTPTNNIFDAEFTPIRSDETFPGYSGSTLGTGIIQLDSSNDFGAYSDAYPLLDDAHDQAYGNFVGYLFKEGATLTYNIYSDRAVSGVKLYAQLAYEIINEPLVISPEGPFGYLFNVNGVSINYGSIDLSPCAPADVTGMNPHKFHEFFISNINLVEGLNVITLVTNNANNTFNGGIPAGTMGAIAPQVDYIRLETSSATLSWHPEYDNLYRD